MITTEQARILALASEAASNASGGNTPQLEGYTALPTSDLNDPNTGLSLTIFQKNGTTGEFIVAFAGTGNAQDFAADLDLGKPQWRAKGTEIINYLNSLGATNISFTGRSLGGALAQYAAYDYLATTQASAQVSLTTYNGLGGMAGLQQMHPDDFDSTLASSLDAAHFFTKSGNQADMVARLGDGHFGGNTYQINMSETDKGFIDVHLAWNYFNNLTTIPSSATLPEYLTVPWAQKLAALFAFAGDDGKFDNTEGFFRAAGGVLLSASAAPLSEFDQLIDAMLPDKAFIDWGMARDLMPLQMRLSVAILGMESVAVANRYQLVGNATEWTREQIKATVNLMEKAVEIQEYALKQAIETGSELIDAARDIYMEGLDYAANRIMDLADMFDKAIDYTADKWREMKNLSNQVEGWLKEQLAYVGQVANEMTKLGSWAIKFLIGDSIDSNLLAFRDLFTTAKTAVSPIILDLDGDGVETTVSGAGAYFDHDGNGFAEQTGWASSDDGILVRDINENGTIDTGKELFGNETLLNSGSKASNGFQALSELDGNADGKRQAIDNNIFKLAA